MSEYVQTVENGDISNSSGDISSDCSGNNTESFSSDLNEEERMKLYDKIRTKNNFMLTQIEEEKSPKFQKNSILDQIKLLNINQSNFESEKKDCINKNVTKKIIKNSNIKEDPVFQKIYKLVEKLKIIRLQNKDRNSKKKVPSADLFYYDKKKWGENKLNKPNNIIVNAKEFKVNREATFKKLFLTPHITIKVEDMLKMYKTGRILI